MHPHEAIIQNFYLAFQQKDFAVMQASYHRDATFTDPVFQNLSASEVKAMWEMLLTSAHDLKLEFNNIHVDDRCGSCHWEAWYTFSSTGRKVHNVIEAAFEFKDGKIFRHEDHFNLWRWSGMALGTSGWLLGWLPLVQNKLRGKARHRLTQFIKKRNFSA